MVTHFTFSHFIFNPLDSQVIADLRRVMRLRSNDPLPATAHEMVG